METKLCSRCKVEKARTDFYKSKGTKDGLSSSCVECQNLYEITRKKNDPIYKIRKDIARSIRHILLYENSYNLKENSKLRLILGCTLDEFKSHLESLFEPWMNWSNRGLYNGQLNYGWDIDHIIPCSTAKTEEEMIKLYHYTNLRPRCSYTNRVTDRIKRNKKDTNL